MSVQLRLANLSYAQLLEIAVWTLFSAGCRNLEWSTDIYGRKDARTSRLRRYKRNVSMKKNPAFSRPRHLALISALHVRPLSHLGPREPEHDDLARIVTRDEDLVAVHTNCKDITSQIDANSLQDVA